MDSPYWIGVDFGGTNIRVGLLDRHGRIVEDKKELTRAERSPRVVIQHLEEMIRQVKGEREVEGIGIGMPGPLDPQRGIVQSPVNLPGWHDVPLAEMLSESFGVPCFIDNDCNVAALGEALAGAGRGFPIVFYITVSTGVGGGLCVFGEIFNGATGNAGEIANIIIDSSEDLRHSFLNMGSLESLASGTGILRMAAEKGLAVSQASDVFLLAEEGDQRAKTVVDRAVDALGRGMAAIAHVVDPHVFVLGGGVAQSVPNFAAKVRSRFESYIYEIMRGKIAVRKAELRDPGMVGAMLMAQKRVVRTSL